MQISREKYANLDITVRDKYTSLDTIPRDKYASLDTIPRDKYASLDTTIRDKYTSLDTTIRDKYASLDSMPNLIYSGQTSPLNITAREFSRDCVGDGSFWTPSSSSRSHLHPIGGTVHPSGETPSYDPGYNSYHSTIDADNYTGSTPGGATGHNSFYNPYGGVSGGAGSSDSPLQDSNTHPWTTGVFYADRDFGTRDLHPLQRPGYIGTDSNGNYPEGEYHNPWPTTVQPCNVLDLQHDVMNKRYNEGTMGGGVTMGDMDSTQGLLSSSFSNSCGGGSIGGSGGGGGKRKRRRVITIDQRRAANVRERRRMSHLNEAFDGLRKRVPTFAYEKKLSRIDTLRLSVMYIKFMAELLDSLSVVGEGGCVVNHGVPTGVRVGNGNGRSGVEKSTGAKKSGTRGCLSVDVHQDVGGGGEGKDIHRGLQRMSAAVGSVCTDDEDGDGEESYLSDPSEEEEEEIDRGGARGEL